MTELRIIIAGGRDFTDLTVLSSNMNRILRDKKDKNINFDRVTTISGNARGADKLGEQWSNLYNVHSYKFPANWDFYGKSAGYRRNAEMAKFAVEDGNIGMLIAFWDGKSRGTKHMIDLANRYGLEVHVINY